MLIVGSGNPDGYKTLEPRGFIQTSKSKKGILLSQHNEVIALDIIPEKVDMLNKGISPIEDKEYLTMQYENKNAFLKQTILILNQLLVIQKVYYIFKRRKSTIW